jgi:HEAT repeat protein
VSRNLHERAQLGRQVALPLAVVLALGGTLNASTQEGQTPPAVVQVDNSAFRAIEAILTPPATGAKPQPEKMAAAIAALGQPGLTVVVAMLAGDVAASPYVQDSLDEPVHPLALEQRTEILTRALAGFPRGMVLEHLAERLQGEPNMDLRLMVAGWLGELDDPRAFAMLLELVGGIEPIHLMRSYVQGSLEGALSAHLARRSSALAELAAAARDADPAKLAIFARAIGATHSSRGIEQLIDWLGRDLESDVVLLNQIGRVAGEGGLAVSDASEDLVRRQLLSEDPQVRRSALVAIGRLRDEQAFEDLLVVLGEEPLSANSALWSLKRICGVDFGRDAEAWKAWREREKQWWTERGPQLVASLHSEQPGVVLGAVSELLTHPLHRHEAAEALGPLVVHTDPHIARGVCVAIARLESSRAVPWLVDALMNPDPELRRLAGEALRSLTGLDLPAEHLVWSRILAS